MSETTFRELGGDVFFQLPGTRPTDDEVESAPAQDPAQPATIEQTVRRMRRGTEALQRRNRQLSESYVESNLPEGDEREEERRRRRREVARVVNIGMAPESPVQGQEREGLNAAERALMMSQGASFGFGDELAAAVQAPFSDRTYDELQSDYQSSIDRAHRVAPVESALLEMAGGAAGGVAGGARGVSRGFGRIADDVMREAFESQAARTARQATQRAAAEAAPSALRRGAQAIAQSSAVGGAGGGLYGAGASRGDTLSDRADAAVASGIAGAAVGGLLPPVVGAVGATASALPRAVRGVIDQGPGALVPESLRRRFHVNRARRNAPERGQVADQVREMTRAPDETVDLEALRGAYPERGPYRTPEPPPMTAREARRFATDAVLLPSQSDDLARSMADDLNLVFEAGDVMREQGAITLKPARVREFLQTSPPQNVPQTSADTVGILRRISDTVSETQGFRGNETGAGSAALRRVNASIDRAVRDMTGLELRSLSENGRRRSVRDGAIDWDEVGEAAQARIEAADDPVEEAARIFNTLEQVKRTLGRGAQQFRNTDRGLHETFAGLRPESGGFGYEQLRQFLQDADAWGPAMSDAQVAVNRAYAEGISAGRPFRRAFAQLDSGERGGELASNWANATRADTSALARYVRNQGRVDDLDRARHLERGVDTTQQLSESLGAFYDVPENVGQIIDRGGAAARRMRQTMDDVQRRRRPALALEDIIAQRRLSEGAEVASGPVQFGPRSSGVMNPLRAVRDMFEGDPADSIRALRALDDLPPSREVWGPYAERAAQAQQQGAAAMSSLVQEMATDNPSQFRRVQASLDSIEGDGVDIDEILGFSESIGPEGFAEDEENQSIDEILGFD